MRAQEPDVAVTVTYVPFDTFTFRADVRGY